MSEAHLVPYFAAEQQEALLFMAVGLAAVALATWLWMARHPRRAMAYPLVAIAAIQLTVGATVYFRTDAQVAALRAQYAENPTTFRSAETARMQVVVRNFKTYKWIEIALLVAGLALLLLRRQNLAASSVGWGLAAQSALMLVLDLFAERRADQYLAFVMST